MNRVLWSPPESPGVDPSRGDYLETLATSRRTHRAPIMETGPSLHRFLTARLGCGQLTNLRETQLPLEQFSGRTPRHQSRAKLTTTWSPSSRFSAWNSCSHLAMNDTAWSPIFVVHSSAGINYTGRSDHCFNAYGRVCQDLRSSADDNRVCDTCRRMFCS